MAPRSGRRGLGTDEARDRQGAAIALNQDRIGHRYPAYRYEVSREKIREYALATGLGDPAYTDDRADVVAPPTFPACFTVTRGGEYLLADAELGAHTNMVHGSQRYELHRVLRPGDVLECEPWITDITARGRHELLTLQIDCRELASGDPAVTSRGMLVFLDSADRG